MSILVADKIEDLLGQVPPIFTFSETADNSGKIDLGEVQVIWGKGVNQGNIGGGRLQETITYHGGGFPTKTLIAACYGISRSTNTNTEISVLQYWNSELTTNTEIVIDYREIQGWNQNYWANAFIAIGH